MNPVLTRSLFLLSLLAGSAALRAQVFLPARTADDLSNPHKGYMHWGTTFATDGGVDDFYNSRIFHVYVPWREVETADQVFDWNGFEARHIDPIITQYPDASFVLRLVADYPDGPGSGISTYYSGGQNDRDYPLFLEQAPLNIPASNYSSCDGDGPGRTPDWNNASMIAQMQQLVTALATRYDGDPRITAVQVGLLGLWGEWHQSGCESAAPGNAAKAALRDRYQQAFLQTPLQTRYPRAADVGTTEFGFHEDYFPSFTGNCNAFAPALPLCDDSGNWNMEWAFSNESPTARDNWISNPVSGESPLSSQKNVWVSRRADIESLIRQYHFSFLGPAGKHEEAGFLSALAPLRRVLGYNLHLDRVGWPANASPGTALAVTATIANTGSAPLYQDFALRLDLVDALGAIAWSGTLTTDPRGALPDVDLMISESLILPPGLAAGSYSLRAAMPSLVSGRPGVILQSGPRDAEARVILGTVQITASSGLLFLNGFE